MWEDRKSETVVGGKRMGISLAHSRNEPRVEIPGRRGRELALGSVCRCGVGVEGFPSGSGQC